MTLDKITVSLEIKQVWTFPTEGRLLAVTAINGEETLMEFDL